MSGKRKKDDATTQGRKKGRSRREKTLLNKARATKAMACDVASHSMHATTPVPTLMLVPPLPAMGFSAENARLAQFVGPPSFADDDTDSRYRGGYMFSARTDTTATFNAGDVLNDVLSDAKSAVAVAASRRPRTDSPTIRRRANDSHVVWKDRNIHNFTYNILPSVCKQFVSHGSHCTLIGNPKNVPLQTVFEQMTLCGLKTFQSSDPPPREVAADGSTIGRTYILNFTSSVEMRRILHHLFNNREIPTRERILDIDTVILIGGDYILWPTSENDKRILRGISHQQYFMTPCCHFQYGRAAHDSCVITTNHLKTTKSLFVECSRCSNEPRSIEQRSSTSTPPNQGEASQRQSHGEDGTTDARNTEMSQLSTCGVSSGSESSVSLLFYACLLFTMVVDTTDKFVFLSGGNYTRFKYVLTRMTSQNQTTSIETGSTIPEDTTCIVAQSLANNSLDSILQSTLPFTFSGKMWVLILTTEARVRRSSLTTKPTVVILPTTQPNSQTRLVMALYGQKELIAQKIRNPLYHNPLLTHGDAVVNALWTPTQIDDNNQVDSIIEGMLLDRSTKHVSLIPKFAKSVKDSEEDCDNTIDQGANICRGVDDMPLFNSDEEEVEF